MEKKYLVCDERENEIFCDVFDDPEEAALSARAEWDHLTKGEQRKAHVYSIVVTLDDLGESAIDEDGNIDWAGYESCDTYPGSFDSDHANEFDLMRSIRQLASRFPESMDEIIREVFDEVMNFVKSQNLDIESRDFETVEKFVFLVFDFYRTHSKFPRAAIEKDGWSIISNTDLARAVTRELELLGHNADYDSILLDIDIERDEADEAIPVLPEIIKSYASSFLASIEHNRE